MVRARVDFWTPWKAKRTEAATTAEAAVVRRKLAVLVVRAVKVRRAVRKGVSIAEAGVRQRQMRARDTSLAARRGRVVGPVRDIALAVVAFLLTESTEAVRVRNHRLAAFPQTEW